jgi:septal ring factor EnvC (AmiA/AmiB activator)
MKTGEEKTADAKPGAEKPATGSQPVAAPQSTAEQIEGLRAWVAQIDRKLGIRSLAGGLAIVLALAAGIVGVVLAIGAKDESATKAEVTSLRDEVSASTREVSRAAADDLTAINERIDALEGRVATIASSQRTSESELQVVQDDIDDLRGQLTDLESEVSAIESAPPPTADGSNN